MSKAKLRTTIEGSRIKKDKFVLPNDILFNILVKVYTASLLRFKCVSKSWNAMISDNVKFTKAHRDQSKVLGREKLLLQKSTGEFEFIYFNNLNKVITEKKQFPLKEFQGAHVLCSYDGLVLLKKPKAYKRFVLWNPSSRQHHILECSYMKPREYTLPRACGLCYDSTTDDYKVILIYSLFYVVYSTSRDSWTKKPTLPVLQQRLPELELVSNSRRNVCSQGIGTKNHVYWSLNQKLDHYVRKTSTIIYFSAKSDELKESPIQISTNEYEYLFHLSTLKGRLCAYGGNCDFNGLNIWIMKQECWKWLMRIRNIPTFDCEGFLNNYKLLCTTENCEVIFHGPERHSFSIYYPKQRQFVRTTYISNHLEYVFCPVDPTCLDSLYFPRFNVMRKRKRRSTPSE
ncbi:F-box/kelch-repeat protein At3g23880-like [Lycium ferocissimum]|uniref:F-box/kelch-repeat protein At3g23880-like n=1 Tax=Lycium ferocissimum TaxID=112874 RepID=UPI00281549DE|nr:F-box/kelch-repeat protein At3g23880-like [Lycium ferocissimum]